MSDTPSPEPRKPRMVGINHVAIEVGDVEQALAFYGRIFTFTLRGRSEGSAFIDMGDQFLAMTETAAAPRSGEHRSAERRRQAAAGDEAEIARARARHHAGGGAFVEKLQDLRNIGGLTRQRSTQLGEQLGHGRARLYRAPGQGFEESAGARCGVGEGSCAFG